MTDHPLSNDINEAPAVSAEQPIEPFAQISMPTSEADTVDAVAPEVPVAAVTEDSAPFDEPAVPFDEPAVPFDEPAVPFDEPVVSFDEPVVPAAPATAPSAAEEAPAVPTAQIPPAEPAAPTAPSVTQAPPVTQFTPPAAQEPQPRPTVPTQSPYASKPLPYAGNSAQRQTAKPPKKKSHLGLKLAAIVLVCTLLGSVFGGAIVGCYFEFFKNDSAQAQKPTQYRPGASSISNNQQTTVPTTTLAQLYSTAVPSIVGITNQYTTYSYFGQSSTSTATGTGFIISEDGEILTNYHVVEGAQQLSVTMYDGAVFEAKVLGYEAESDVALLKINVEGLTPVALGNSDVLAVGEQIAAIGNPLGELTYTMTVGYVSAKGRAVYTDEKPINMMQIDAAINSGNSGGPLFNLAGEVVGITTAKYSGSSNGSATIEGIGFAIPINDVLFILDDLREYGSVQNRAYIGVTITNSIAGGDIPQGALVQSVTRNSCGDKAGLRVSDIIVAVGETTVTSIDTLYQALRPYRAGDTVTMTVFRSGETVELTITFDAAPGESVEEPTEEPSYEFPWDYFFP